ncbi:hypothetical protein AAKU55_005896 [Oxalobacteraceae bacterium GrIS 1.11]
MEILFKDQLNEWQYDRFFTIGGDGCDNSIVAQVAITTDCGLRTRIDILSTAGYSCFQSARYVDGIAYIGFGVYVFVVDIESKQIACHRLDGYFGGLYSVDDIEGMDGRFSVFVTSASEVLAFGRSGKLFWKRPHLGIDGVLLHSTSADRLEGAGEWDPPGGWRKFALLIDSGNFVSQNGD